MLRYIVIDPGRNGILKDEEGRATVPSRSIELPAMESGERIAAIKAVWGHLTLVEGEDLWKTQEVPGLHTFWFQDKLFTSLYPVLVAGPFRD